MMETPYYAVIFSSEKSEQTEGYEAWSEKMQQLAATSPGYLGHESYKNDDGKGVTISYWSNLESVSAWKNHPEHLQAQALGKEKWYKHYAIRICRVEREYEFPGKI